MLEGQDKYLEVNSVLTGNTMILLSSEIPSVMFGEHRLIAAVVGMTPSYLGERLSLYREGSQRLWKHY